MIRSREMRPLYWRNAYRAFVEKPDGRRPLGIPAPRWYCNTEVALKGLGWWACNCF